MLTGKQKKIHIDVFVNFLSHLQTEPQTFLDRIGTTDDTYHFDPETKQQSMMLKRHNSLAAKNEGHPISE